MRSYDSKKFSYRKYCNRTTFQNWSVSNLWCYYCVSWQYAIHVQSLGTCVYNKRYNRHACTMLNKPLTQYDEEYPRKSWKYIEQPTHVITYYHRCSTIRHTSDCSTALREEQAHSHVRTVQIKHAYAHRCMYVQHARYHALVQSDKEFCTAKQEREIKRK